jgi:uncharacterized membrane protein YphA (DoxX/SURF4 family)
MTILHIVALVFEGLLGVFSVYASYTLFAQKPESIAKQRAALHYPRWYWVLAGYLSAIGGIGLFVGLAIPAVGAIAAVWMIAYFVVAAFSHVIRKDFASIAFPLFFLVLFLGLSALRWTDITAVLASVGM